MSDFSSINIDKLTEFLDASAEALPKVTESHSTLNTFLNTVREGCEAGAPEEGAMAKAFDLTEIMSENETFARAIRDDVGADKSGTVAFSESGLIEQLESEGILEKPDVVEFEEAEVLGLAPTSGFADDPVCTANGNFIYVEQDLVLPGFGSTLNIVRTYNSQAPTVGVFGVGWFSLLDMKLEKLDGSDAIRVSLADGGATLFQPKAEGGFRFDGRRGLYLTTLDQGWQLRDRRGAAWLFSADGELTGGTSRNSPFIVRRENSGQTIEDGFSGRSVTYRTNDDGLVQQAESSDGRAITYSYDDLHCLHTERDNGDAIYGIEDGRIVTVHDADGVMLCQNTYDDNQRVETQRSPHGLVSRYEYLNARNTRITYGDDGPANLHLHDERGNLLALHGADGTAQRSTFEEFDRRLSLTSRGGLRTTFEYESGDEKNLLVRWQRGERERCWAYDDLDRPHQRTDQSGHVTRYEYEGTGPQPAKVIGPLEDETCFSYDDRGLVTSLVDPDGYPTNFEWNQDGQVTTVEDAAGRRTSLAYDHNGTLSQVTEPSGTTSSYTHTAGGKLQSTVRPDGVTVTFDTSDAGRVTGSFVDDTLAWSATYGEHGLLDTFTDVVGGSTSFGYNPFGNVETVTATNGATTTFARTALGQVEKIEDHLGNTSSKTYSPDGHVLSVTNVEGRCTQRSLDAEGRALSVTSSTGSTTEFSHDISGNVISRTTPDGRTYRYELDCFGRIVAETDPTGNRVTYRYSAAGRLLVYTSPAGRAHRCVYDDAGNLAEVVDQEGRKASTPLGRTVPQIPEGASPMTFNLRGLLTEVADPAGITTVFTYDELRRRTQETTADIHRQFSFDETGSLASVVDGLGNETVLRNSSTGRPQGLSVDGVGGFHVQHDEAGRVSELVSDDGNRIVNYSYGQDGLVDSVTNEHGVVHLNRDHSGAVVTATDLNGGETHYVRDPDGLVVQRVEPDGLTVDYVRSPSGRLLGFSLEGIGTINCPEPTVGGQLNAGGQIEADEHGRMYRYDLAGRLIESVTASGQTSTFAYNDLGLLASEQTPQLGARSFTYNDACQVVAAGHSDTQANTTFTYDKAGRRLSQMANDGSRVDYTWNELNELVAIDRTDNAGQTSTRAITYSGLRRPEKIDGVTIGWDDAITKKPVRVGAERYVRSGGKVLSLLEPEQRWSDLTFDDPWGADSSEGVGLGYRGELTVDGLIFMGDRVYDPETRSFLSRDPLPPVAGANGYANLYNYAWNDPVNFVDPTGRSPISIEEFAEIERKAADDSRGAPEWVWDEGIVDPVTHVGRRPYKAFAGWAFKEGYGNDLPREFIEHYQYGDGETWHFSEEEMREFAVDPFFDIELRRADGTPVTGVGSQEATQITEDLNILGGGEVDVEFNGHGGAVTNGTLGNFTINYDGTIAVDPQADGNYDWSFEGNMNFEDTYDFNASDHRPWPAEQLTSAGRNFLPGEEFDVTTDDTSVSISGTSGTTVEGAPNLITESSEWEGADVEDTPNRIFAEESEDGNTESQDPETGDLATGELGE